MQADTSNVSLHNIERILAQFRDECRAKRDNDAIRRTFYADLKRQCTDIEGLSSVRDEDGSCRLFVMLSRKSHVWSRVDLAALLPCLEVTVVDAPLEPQAERG